MIFRKYWKWILFVFLVISITITVILCAYLIPRVEYAYDSITDTYYVADVYGNAKSYVIKDEVKGKPVTKIKAKAFMDKTNLEELSMGKNVTEIERLAFNGCHQLKKIDLSNIKVIGRSAFADCSSLTSVHLYVEHITGGTFFGCESLEEVILENTKSIGSYAFSFTAVKSITLPATMESLSVGAFDDCSLLKEIIVQSKYLVSNDYLKQFEGTRFEISPSL